MALIERTFSPSALPGAIANRSWLGETARASAIALDGFVWDTALLPPPPDDGRAYFVFPLRGAMHLVDVGELIVPGRAVVFPSAANSFTERTLVVGHHVALALRVERRCVVDAMRPRSFAFATPAVAETHAAIVSGDEEAIRRGLGGLARALAAAGLLDSTDLDRPLTRTEADGNVARALSRALTFARERPAMIDLDLDGSERHVRRRVDAFLRRHRMPFARWRDMRQSFNLTGAALALTLPGVTTEAAASALGFASSTSLCHALQRGGLPAPQVIARRSHEARARVGG